MAGKLIAKFRACIYKELRTALLIYLEVEIVHLSENETDMAHKVVSSECHPLDQQKHPV
jgi:hypothetical protein